MHCLVACHLPEIHLEIPWQEQWQHCLCVPTVLILKQEVCLAILLVPNPKSLLRFWGITTLTLAIEDAGNDIVGVMDGEPAQQVDGIVIRADLRCSATW